MSEEEKIALFDGYLAGELSVEEKHDFEQKLSTDSGLREELESYKKISAEIYEGEEYGEIKNTLKNIHQNIYSKKSFFLRPQFLVPVGIAAGIALLFTVVNPWTNNNLAGDADMGDYQELVHAEEESADDEASYSEEASDTFINPIEVEMDSAVSFLDELLPIANGQPKGTCFLISKEGYFITSKHLVRKRRYVKVQQKDRDVAFRTEVVYRDSVLDFAVLKCSEAQADEFKSVPFRFYRGDSKLGDDVFTLGYPKSDIVYTKGVISSETGFKSDSMSFQISMPSNPGNSGAPLFTKKGDLIGMVIANNSKKQSVTYILKPNYIQKRIQDLNEVHDIDISKNYTKRFNKTSDLISKYRPYIFEIH